MKAPPFRYHRPAGLDEAVALLDSLPGARPLAGGQSLMAMMNLRLAGFDDLVDIGRIPALAGIRDEGGRLAIGAMTRQQDIARDPAVAARIPLLVEALAQVGHRQTRNWGTIGGSLCHLDPAAELPTVAAAMDAELEIRGAAGTRTLPMSGFALGPMTTALEPTELLTAVRLAPWPAGHGWAFLEFARRHGDFALAGVAALITLEGGRIGRVAIALGGVGGVPFRLEAAEALLAGAAPEPAAIDAAAACCDRLDVMDDPNVPAWYRRRLARTLTARALRLALTRAGAAGARH
ncbi:xanthine dehydrogenase family protein subunit M [Pigmentiphaga soli]|uniref:Xanthine dehydrogenase family protein subunit M n=1 Tax=Pigmentiphaga soli TaxID=1007095 RepID=A0ABP8HRY7_9BURK